MTGDEKLIRKFLGDKTQVTVEDCDTLLAIFGFELKKGKGSHRVYHKKYDNPIIVITPKHAKYVKPGYVMLINKRLNLEGDYGNQRRT